MLGRLAGHALITRIGDGGMGTVWLARAEHRNAPLVALKTLRDDVLADPRVRAMFAREMRLAAAIRHPNVASVLTSGEDAGVPYLVMEWVDGRSLRALSRAALAKDGGRVPLGVALRIVHDVCGALHFAHEARGADGAPLGLVHRDVSPHNILVARTGQTKLIDFGVAKVRELAPGDASSSGSVKGKVRYMAPEQALARRVDRRADVFALGIVLFELVTGRPPFEAPNDLAVLCELLAKAPVAIPGDVPAPIQSILHVALSKRLKDRYPTALAMQEAIGAAIVELGVGTTEAEIAAFLAVTEPDDALRRAVTAATDPLDAPTVVTTTARTASAPRRGRAPSLWLLAGFAAAALTAGGALLGRGAQASDEVPLTSASLETTTSLPATHAPSESDDLRARADATSDVTSTQAAPLAPPNAAPTPNAEAEVANDPRPAPAARARAATSWRPARAARAARPARDDAAEGTASRDSHDDLASSLRDRR